MCERKYLRLRRYDYAAQGAYFVTVCTRDRECLLGDVVDGSMKVNRYGEIVLKCWYDLPNHYSHCCMDECIVMPNHFHGIIMIDDVPVGNGFKPFPTKPLPTDTTDKLKQHGLSEIIRGFKTFSSRRINEIKDDSTFRWQKSFYDRIIRNEGELDRIRQYIMSNPQNWESDRDVADIGIFVRHDFAHGNVGNGLKPFPTLP